MLDRMLSRVLIVAPIALVLSLFVTACSDGGSVDAFCAQVTEVPQFASLLDSDDPATAFRDAVAALRSLEEAAPKAIKGDVTRVADTAEAIADELAGAASPVDPADTELLQAQLDATAEASTHVVDYAREHCGVDLGPPVSAVPSTTAG